MKSTAKFCFPAFILIFCLASACNGDDKGNSCSKLYGKIGQATAELMSGNCEVVVAGYDKLIDLYDKGRDCKEIKQGIEGEGFNNVDEFIAELQELRDAEAADCTAP